MKLKKILTYSCKVVIIIALAVFINLLFMPKYINENKDGSITREFYREKTNADIIFAGSSTVYSDISPLTLWEKFGHTSYIRSNASQTMWQSYYLIEDALRYTKPNLVVLDIGFMKYGDDFAEEPSSRKIIDEMRLNASKIACIKASMFEKEKMIEYLFPIFRFHSRWMDLKAEDWQYAIFKKEVTYNGFIMDFNISDEKPIASEKLGKDSYEFGEKSKYYLEKVIELCKENNIDVLLIKTPSFGADWYPEYDENIEKIAESKGISYINFEGDSDAIGLNYQIHSNDGGGHLNTVGAELFTEYLGEIITKCYSLKDHRQDEPYTRIWNQKLERYNQDKAIGLEEYYRKIKGI